MTESESTPPGPATEAPAGAPPPTAAAPAFRDRKIGLILFGVLQLLMALGFLVITALQLLLAFSGEALAEGGEPQPRLFVVVALMYALLGAGAAWLGIGSIRCRRWARAVTLALAWLGLVTGVVGSVFLVAIFPAMADQADAAGAEATGAMAFAMGCMLVVVGFFYIVLPLSFVLFYRSLHVKATCEHYDPTPRWTDPIPIPVLIGGILLLSMVSAAFGPLMGTPLPFFGQLLTGLSAWIYAVVFGGLAAVAVWGFFRLEHWAWLAAVLLMGVSGISAYVTFSGDGFLQMYEAMGMAPEELAEMQAIGLLRVMPPVLLVSLTVMLGFYLWLGRYFRGSDTVSSPG